ncbi:MAG: SDR family oxidoreductase [Paracoccaceae bacterium]
MMVLVLGADGFIGRHLAFHLRKQGVQVTAHAREPRRLAAMGFATLKADLTNPTTHSADFWRPHLTPDTHILNAAGLLTGSARTLHAVHALAPAAAYAARGPDAQALLMSAVGLTADTPFAAARREGEAVALSAGAMVLRAGLVLADTSYGGSSLIRALAALPFVTPIIGTGTQPFNPIHATDLAEAALHCLQHLPGPGPWEIGGPDQISQADLIRATQGWLGLPATRLLPLPLPLAHRIGQMGDVLQLGPISATSVAQLTAGVLANPRPLLAHLPSRPRGFRTFLHSRPAGTQDLWQARLYLLKPLIRLVLAALWLASAALGLLLPASDFLPAISALPETTALILARGGGLVDAAIGIALLRNWRPKTTAILQVLMVAGYTLGLTLIAPALWLDPFGGLLKNLPILALILTHLALSEER